MKPRMFLVNHCAVIPVFKKNKEKTICGTALLRCDALSSSCDEVLSPGATFQFKTSLSVSR